MDARWLYGCRGAAVIMCDAGLCDDFCCGANRQQLRFRGRLRKLFGLLIFLTTHAAPRPRALLNVAKATHLGTHLR